MNIIIFYEHIAREMDSCNRIMDEIKKYKNLNVFKFSIIFEYYKAISFLKKNDIAMVIIPWLYSKKEYELLMPFINHNPNIIVINLHHEQIGSVISDCAVLPRDEASKNSVIHFVWGENFRNMLLKSGVYDNLIFVTGNIRTDFINRSFNNNYLKKKYSLEFNLDLSKKWILYSENRDWVWGNKRNMKKTYLNSGCSIEDFENFYKESVCSLNKTISNIKKLNDSFFDEFEFIYRQHPGTFVNNNIDDRIKIINKGNIYEWLSIVDANIVSGSTTIFESDLCGVPSFTDISFYMSDRYQTYGIYDYFKIKDFNEITDELLIKVKKQDGVSKKYEKYIGVVDGKVAERIAKQIFNILNSNREYNNYYVKIHKFKFWIKFFREKIIFILYKTKLLNLLNWPNYAIRMKDDIPF